MMNRNIQILENGFIKYNGKFYCLHKGYFCNVKVKEKLIYYSEVYKKEIGKRVYNDMMEFFISYQNAGSELNLSKLY